MPTPAQLGLTNDVWITIRTDNPVVDGDGTLGNPFDGRVRLDATKTITLLSSAGQLVTATVASHGYSSGHIVRVTGASPLYNGTFVIAYLNANQFTYVATAPPGANSSGSAQKVEFRFDTVMKSAAIATATNIRVNLGPGTFETQGIYDVDTVSPIGWQAKTGMKIRGAGMFVTTLKLVVASVSNKHYYAIGTGVGTSQFVTNFEASDLTIDGNIQNQPRSVSAPLTEFAPVACGAICITGAGTRISRVRAINFGTQVQGIECKVIVAARASAVYAYPEVKDCIVDDCVIELPGENNFDRTSCIVMSADEPVGGFAPPPMSLHKNCVVQNCFIDCVFANGVSSNLMGISALSNPSGTTARLTTLVNHGLAVGRAVVVNGARTTGNNLNIAYNGVFKITTATPADRIEYSMASAPPATSAPIDFVLVGTVFRGVCVDGGIGAIVEGNRIYNCRHGVYLNTVPSTDITIRNNYFYLVSSACIAGANGRIQPGASIVGGTAVQDETFNLQAGKHGFSIGTAVRILTAFPGSAWDGYYKVTSVSPTGTSPGWFTYNRQDNTGSATLPVYTVGTWNLGRLVFENNVVELNPSDAQGSSLQPVAVNLFGAWPSNYLAQTPTPNSYLITDAIIRSNLIRLKANSTDTVPLAVKISSVQSTIVEDNLVNLPAASPLQYVAATIGQAQPTASNNRSTSNTSLTFSAVSS